MKHYRGYIPTIGIEIHVQLNTKQKIFCFCTNESGIKEPNKNICPICCGYPGTLPLMNKDVIDSAIKVGLSTNCIMTMRNQFARKHYFYADLPKGYQITQSDLPICQEGFVEIISDDKETKKIRIKRIHMEEDAGKNLHSDQYGSLVDLNRAGTPLLEIVTYPDISSAEEAYAYLKKVYMIVTALGVTSGNMEDGAFRADTNISVRKIGQNEFGTKCELKNINSFKFIKDATAYEIDRQIDALEAGEMIVQQTRLWDTKEKKTYGMRDKETAADYRYLPDPDIPWVVLSEEQIEFVRRTLPELPDQTLVRLQKDYQLSVGDAEILLSDLSLLRYFEKTYALFQSKLVINWLLRDLIGLVKEKNIIVEDILLTPGRFALLLKMIDCKEISASGAKIVLNALLINDACPMEYAKQHNLLIEKINVADLKLMIENILIENQAVVEELRAGKEKARGFLIGKVMAVYKGKVDPILVNKLFDEIISL